MRHIWSVLCRFALQNGGTGNFSLVETFGSIEIEADLPTERPLNLPFPCHVVSLWYRDEDDSKIEELVRVRLLSPQTEELMSVEVTVDLKQHEHYRTNVNTDFFSYTLDGTYEFEIAYKLDDEWVVASCIPVQVNCRQPDNASPPH